jgi:hypothetical protein
MNSLATATPCKVERVELLATGAPMLFSRDAAGLPVKVPPSPPGEHAFALKIVGREFTVEEGS